MIIPFFHDAKDSSKYFDLFEEKLTDYLYVLNRVREEMYGKGNGNYANLPGSCLREIVSITNDIAYSTTQQFENLYPQYKDDAEHGLYSSVPRLEEVVKQAVKEAWNSEQ